MTPEQVGVVVAALLALAGVLYTANVTKTANTRSAELQRQQLALEQRTVDRQAYDRARVIDQETINGLRRDLSSKDSVIENVRRELADERRELADAHRENARLRDQIEDCHEQIRVLRRRLAQAGVIDDRRPGPQQDDPAG